MTIIISGIIVLGHIYGFRPNEIQFDIVLLSKYMKVCLNVSSWSKFESNSISNSYFVEYNKAL